MRSIILSQMDKWKETVYHKILSDCPAGDILKFASLLLVLIFVLFRETHSKDCQVLIKELNYKLEIWWLILRVENLICFDRNYDNTGREKIQQIWRLYNISVGNKRNWCVSISQSSHDCIGESSLSANAQSSLFLS